MASPLKKSIWRHGITHSTLKRLPGTVYVNRPPAHREAALFVGLCVFGRPEKGLNPQRSLSLEKGEKQGGKGETQGTSTSSARDSLLKKA